MWQIANATGWSVHCILWRISWQMLLLMLADAPRYIKQNSQETPKQDTLTLFQSLLKNLSNEAR